MRQGRLIKNEPICMLVLVLLCGSAMIVSTAVSEEERLIHEVARLTASDATEGAGFGRSVSVSGGTMVIGAKGQDQYAGAAYVFEKAGSQWTLGAKLTAGQAECHTQFGSSVATDGETILVGAPYGACGSWHFGAVYVFERIEGTWIQTDKLTVGDEIAYSLFGCSVSLSGETAVVAGKGGNGSAHVFEKMAGTWEHVATLVPDTISSAAEFGEHVAVSGDIIVVGVYWDFMQLVPDDMGVSGLAYVFEKLGAGWTLTGELTQDDPTERDYFGGAVATNGRLVLVGAWGDDDRGDNTGSVYVFEREGWTWAQTSKLFPSTRDAATGDNKFGRAISVTADTMVVGAPSERGIGKISWVYVFRDAGMGWRRAAKLAPSDAEADSESSLMGGTWFGRSVSVNANTVLVGAHGEENNNGSAYVFEVRQWDDDASEGPAFFGCDGATVSVRTPSKPQGGVLLSTSLLAALLLLARREALCRRFPARSGKAVSCNDRIGLVEFTGQTHKCAKAHIVHSLRKTAS